MNNKKSQRMNRRTFLHCVGATGGGMLLAACSRTHGNEEVGKRLATGPRATPPIVLPSPVPAEPSTTSTQSPLLTDFLALSGLLTGVTNLSPTLGRIYLESLQTDDEVAMSVAALLEQSGVRGNEAATKPMTLDELTEMGIFAEEATRQLADTIIEMWYTGTYRDGTGATVVATYVDALAWQVLRFTKPKTICGDPGFWARGA